MYQCFHCLCNTVVWQNDFDFADYGLDGDGIVHCLCCSNCGAEIEYYVRVDDDDEK